MPHKVELDEDDVLETLNELLEPGTVTSDDETWLILDVASTNGDLDTVLEIIQLKHLRPVGYFSAGAIVAISKDNSNIVSAILDAGLPVDEDLMRAALNSPQKQQYLQLFVASGWDINANLASHTPSALA
jgi:hypothetical protein